MMIRSMHSRFQLMGHSWPAEIGQVKSFSSGSMKRASIKKGLFLRAQAHLPGNLFLFPSETNHFL